MFVNINIEQVKEAWEAYLPQLEKAIHKPTYVTLCHSGYHKISESGLVFIESEEAHTLRTKDKRVNVIAQYIIQPKENRYMDYAHYFNRNDSNLNEALPKYLEFNDKGWYTPTGIQNYED